LLDQTEYGEHGAVSFQETTFPSHARDPQLMRKMGASMIMVT
jgi:hypothetical protein